MNAGRMHFGPNRSGTSVAPRSPLPLRCTAALVPAPGGLLVPPDCRYGAVWECVRVGWGGAAWRSAESQQSCGTPGRRPTAAPSCAGPIRGHRRGVPAACPRAEAVNPSGGGSQEPPRPESGLRTRLETSHCQCGTPSARCPPLLRDRRVGGRLPFVPSAAGFRREWGLIPGFPRVPFNSSRVSVGQPAILLAREPTQTR